MHFADPFLNEIHDFKVTKTPKNKVYDFKV